MSTSSAARAGPPDEAVPPLRELVAQSSRDLFHLALRLTGSRAEADDVLQTAFVRAFEALKAGAFRHQCALKTWLYRIVVNVAFDAKRAQKRLAELEEAGDRGAPSNAEASVELRELREALASLPEDQRAALALKELHGLSQREVAEVLERSEGAVEQLVFRARAALRERFGE